MNDNKVVHINDKDNAVISLFEIEAGGEVTLPDGEVIVVKEHIPASHKIAIVDFKPGDPIIKYGEEIGYAAFDIPKGGWIHAHNIAGSIAFEAAVKEGLQEGGAR